jgi:outer membrane receptor protein involved in Fe transport
VVSSLSVNYTTDKFVLTSVTGYFYDDTPYLMNNDWSEYATISATEEENFHSISEEARYLSKLDSPVNFMVGVYLDKSVLNYVKSLNLDWIPQDPATGNYQWLNDLAGTEGKTESGFAQAIWNILPTLEFDAGARYTHEQKDSFLQNTYANPYIAAGFPVRELSGGLMNFSGNNVSPEATLSWHPDPQMTLYGAYKTGWKSGGAALSSVLSAATTVSEVAFKPEKAQGFEVGFKSTLLDGRLRTITTLYRYVFSDLQVNSWDPNTDSYFTTNAAKALDYGAEEEIAWQATERLTLRASLSFNHSRYQDFSSAQCTTGQPAPAGGLDGAYQNLSGRPTDSAPDKNAIVGFDYLQPAFGNWKVGLSADVFYSDRYYFDPTQSPYAIQPSFARINASVRLTDGLWELSFLGRNLTDRAVIISGQDRPAGLGDIDGVLARPIELVAQVKRKF